MKASVEFHAVATLLPRIGMNGRIGPGVILNMMLNIMPASRNVYKYLHITEWHIFVLFSQGFKCILRLI